MTVINTVKQQNTILKVFCFDELPDTIFLTVKSKGEHGVQVLLSPGSSIYADKGDAAIAKAKALHFMTNANNEKFVIVACPDKIIVY